jgi:surface protein
MTATDMSDMFLGAQNFNQPVSAWDVGRVTNMQQMFKDAVLFNQPLQEWNVTSVITAASMFENAQTLNQPLGHWVFQVKNTTKMFLGAKTCANCNACPEGQFQAAADSKCQVCSAGRWSDELDLNADSQCKNCSRGRWSDKTGLKADSECETCSAGKWANSIQEGLNTDTHCTACSLGRFSAHPNATSEYNCTACPRGKYQDDETVGATTCKICGAGTFADGNNATSCKNCAKGKNLIDAATNASKHDSAEDCTQCPVLTYNPTVGHGEDCMWCPSAKNIQGGATSCNGCVAGLYLDKSSCSGTKDADCGQCEDCASGRYTDHSNSQSSPPSSCETCSSGKEAPQNKSTGCTQCAKGKMNDMPGGACKDCSEGSFQDKKGSSSCKTCPDGWHADHNGSAWCSDKRPDTIFRDTVLTPEDCESWEYLNISDPHSANHTCAPCPFGAWCEGETTWSNVTAMFGFYRVYDDAADKTPNMSDTSTLPDDKQRPPACLDKEINSPEPKCAFRQCLYPAACLGKNNDKFKGRFLEGSDYFKERKHLLLDKVTADDAGPQDLATYRHWNETCDEDRGYANECTDTHGHPVHCRLCGTCKRGFKRIGSGAQCALCPPPSINIVLLVGGVFVMIIGSAVLIFVTIQASVDLKDDLSDDLKKVLVNFLQISSLAGALPLKWPSVVQSLFETFNTISSAGSNLLIPDCEFSHLKAADVYFGKQIAFALLVPMLLVVVVAAWALIFACSRFVVKRKKKKRLKMRDAKDYTVLSCVFLIFLVYPFLTRMIFSMLKCPQIGDRSYLVADLQEECVGSKNGQRHSTYFAALTIPQIFIYVAGLPIGIFLLLRRNKDKVASNDKSFRIRYGFLFIGFRKERAWWETVTAARKVAVVIIGTFGTVIASPNLQA